jgi:DNA-directed RNA polymerase subunit RPC12/RpoP
MANCMICNKEIINKDDEVIPAVKYNLCRACRKKRFIVEEYNYIADENDKELIKNLLHIDAILT